MPGRYRFHSTRPAPWKRVGVAKVAFTVAVMAVGALSLASAIFLIVELSNPYSGLFRLSPDPVLKTIEALSK